MKKLFLYLIIIVSLSSCVAQNVQHKPTQKFEQSPEQPKKEKDGKVVNIIENTISFMIIGVSIAVLIVGQKHHN